MNSFEETILLVFNKYSPVKKKQIQAIEAPFITKHLHKEIIKQSRLRNKNLKTKSLTDRKNIYINFYQPTKKNILITQTLKKIT